MRTHRLLTPLLALCALTIFGVLTSPAEDMTTLSDLPIANVTAANDLDYIFKPAKRGFLGADGATSTRLDDKRIFWIFGDTILGTVRDGKREGPMARNTIAITTKDDMGKWSAKYYWNLDDNLPGAFFPPEEWDAAHWYWPGVSVVVNGKLYVFLSRMVKGEGMGGLGFSTAGSALVRIVNPQDDPNEWKMTKAQIPYGDDHFGINSACMVEGDWLYLIGYDDPDDKGIDRAGILARMPLKALDSKDPGAAIEFWSKGEKWLSTPDKVVHLFQPGSTETSIHYDKNLKRYITVGIKAFSPEMYLFSAEKLTGPWTNGQKIYDIPDLAKNELYHAYAGKAHPEMTASENPNELLVTYVVNTSDFWSMFTALDIYYPKFVRVTFDESEVKK